MTAKLKPYPKYKDSGVEWLGEVPEGWAIQKLKYSLKIKNGQDYKDLQTNEGGYPVIGSGGEFARASHYIYDGVSILFGRKGTIDKPLLIDCKFWTVDTMFYSIIELNRNPKFLFYRSIIINFDFYSTSTALPSMTQEDLNNITIGLPSFQEQTTIANYLDKQTEKIDKLIENYQKLIALSKEKRTALITHCVTKGLDPNVKMKDSGIEWLGEVPEEWKCLKVKHYGSYKSGDFIQSEDIKINGKYPVIGGNGLRGYSNSYNLCGVYPIIGRQGALCGNINYSEEKSWITEHGIIVRNHKNITNTQWLGYMLFTMNLNQYSMSSAQPGLAVENIINLVSILPSLHEQTIIANYLDKQTAKIDQTIDKAKQAIELLKEKRTALITAAVTGKIDVRECV